MTLDWILYIIAFLAGLITGYIFGRFMEFKKVTNDIINTIMSGVDMAKEHRLSRADLEISKPEIHHLSFGYKPEETKP
jgi:uncharacterized membrane-anchored protein YhcB (DUF1043 family)